MPAELVYGTTLRLPGSFFVTTDIPCSDPADYVNRLKTAMSTLRATPPQSSTRIVNIPSDLFSESHVFVRHDAVRKPLQAPYDGPYRVINRTRKHFTLDIKGKQEIVSVDRLKVAHLSSRDTLSNTPLHEASDISSTSVTNSSPPLTHTSSNSSSYTTRSGRRVHWPDRLTL